MKSKINSFSVPRWDKPQPIRSVGSSVRPPPHNGQEYFIFFKSHVPRSFLTAIAVACSAALVSTVSASVINVQEPGGSNNGGYLVYSGTGAAPDTGTVWNSVPSNVNTAGLEDSQGNVTSVGISSFITSPANNNGSYTVSGGVGNALLQSYYYLYTPSVMGSFTINGLNPGSDYGLYLYAAAGTVGNSNGSTFTVNGITFGTTSGAVSNATANSIPTSDLGITYVEGTVLANTSGDILVSFVANGNTANGGVFNGLQLTGVAVPEPATLALVALGALGLLLVSRKRANDRMV